MFILHISVYPLGCFKLLYQLQREVHPQEVDLSVVKKETRAVRLTLLLEMVTAPKYLDPCFVCSGSLSACHVRRQRQRPGGAHPQQLSEGKEVIVIRGQCLDYQVLCTLVSES